MHPTQTLPVHEADPTAVPATRRFDGQPETDADRRFFDLRESGYTGWIDQDGHPVDGPTFVRTDPESPEIGTLAAYRQAQAMHRRHGDPIDVEPGDLVNPATTLRAAASYLDRHGWCQGGYYEQTGRGLMPAACLVGAIGMVCYGGQVDAPAQHFDDPGWGDFEAAVAHLDGYLTVWHDTDVYSFNDVKGRTAEQVIAALREAADEWDGTDGGAE